MAMTLKMYLAYIYLFGDVNTKYERKSIKKNPKPQNLIIDITRA